MGQFLDKSPHSIRRGKIPNLVVNVGISYNIRYFLPPSGMRGLIQKLTQHFSYSEYGEDKYCSVFYFQSLSKVLPLVILPLKSVISGLSLLSKNLENAISQNGKSEKCFYAPFLIHMVVEFKKSKLPTLLHFVQVKVPYQPHVFTLKNVIFKVNSKVSPPKIF